MKLFFGKVVQIAYKTGLEETKIFNGEILREDKIRKCLILETFGKGSKRVSFEVPKSDIIKVTYLEGRSAEKTFSNALRARGKKK